MDLKAMLKSSSRIPTWPQPEQSIDEVHNPLMTLNRRKYKLLGEEHRVWKAKGPACDAYRSTLNGTRSLEDNIKSLLLSRKPALFEGERQTDLPHTVDLYLVGVEAKRATPCITISCSSKKFCMNAVAIIKAAPWWSDFNQQFPGFRFMHLPSAPKPKRYGSTKNDEASATVFVFVAKTNESICGRPLYFSSTADLSVVHRERVPDATLGGFVFLDSTPYGFTAAHPAQAYETDKSATSANQDDSSDIGGEPGTFCFLDESDDDELQDDTDIMTLTPTSLPESDSSSWALQSSKIPNEIAAAKDVGDENSDIALRLIGIVSYRSTGLAEDGLDWALIKLDAAVIGNVTDWMSMNDIRIRQQLSLVFSGVRTLADQWIETVHAVTVDRKGNVSHGDLAASSSLILLPGSTDYISVYPVKFKDGPLTVGQCGQWIFSVQGSLLGHIVAGTSSCAYLAPAYKVMQDIKTVTRKNATLRADSQVLRTTSVKGITGSASTDAHLRSTVIASESKQQSRNAARNDAEDKDLGPDRIRESQNLQDVRNRGIDTESSVKVHVDKYSHDTTSSHDQPYVYNNLGKRKFRLLAPNLSVDGKTLSGSFETYSLGSEQDRDPNSAMDAFAITESDTPDYAALSYSWGLSNDQDYINIRDDSNPGVESQVKITSTLAQALRHLCKRVDGHEKFLIWVDALCIDRDNIDERNAQVSNMGMIYEQAQEVIVWLGAEADGSHAAIEFVKELSQLSVLERAVSPTGGMEDEIYALRRLIDRDWFSRRWAVQEIAMGRSVVMRCGNDSIEWDEFADAISFVAAQPQVFDIKMLASSNPQHRKARFTGLSVLAALRLVETINKSWYRTIGGILTERMMSLEELMSSLTLFETDSPHDIVYALLWLARDIQPAAFTRESTITPVSDASGEPKASEDAKSDSPHIRLDTTISDDAMMAFTRTTPSMGYVSFESVAAEIIHRMDQKDLAHLVSTEMDKSSFKIDYRQPVLHVYSQFLQHVFDHSKSIDILCVPWAVQSIDIDYFNSSGTKQAGDSSMELPTWIPSRPDKRIFTYNTHLGAYKRLRPDPLVGQPGTGHRNYFASGRTNLDDCRAVIDFQKHRLHVKGFDIGVITRLESPATNGIIPSEWLELFGIDDRPFQRNRLDSSGWRASFRDQKPDWLWRFFVADRGAGGHWYAPMRYRTAFNWLMRVRTAGYGIDTYDIETQNCSSIVKEYLERVQAVVFNQRLAVLNHEHYDQPLYCMVPKEAKEGDTVCVLYGCSVPVVLRSRKIRNAETTSSEAVNPLLLISDTSSDETNGEYNHLKTLDADQKIPAPQIPTITRTTVDNMHEDLTDLDPSEPPPKPRKRKRSSDDELSVPPRFSSKQLEYEFIGEAYVHGMMYGESFNNRKGGRPKTLNFELV